MTVRAKALVILCGALGSLLVAVYLLSHVIVHRSFSRLERSLAVKATQRARDSILKEGDRLDFITRDWAWWDETCGFIEGRNDAFIAANLNDTTLAELDVDLLAFVNPAGRAVYATGFDPVARRFLPVPEGFEEYLAAVSPLLSIRDIRGHRGGVVTLPPAPMLVASRPILSGEGKGPIRGFLIMGRFLNRSRVSGIAETLHESLSVSTVREASSIPEYDEALRALAGGAGIFIRPLDRDRIAGYAALSDIAGAPALVLRIEEPRDISARGRAMLRWVAFSLLAAGLLFGAAVVVLVERVILSRVERLGAGIDEVSRTGNLATRIALPGGDEIAKFAGSVNGLLVALERSQMEVKRSGENYESLFRNMLNGFAFCRIVVDDRAHPVDFVCLEVNGAFERIAGKTREALVGKRGSEALPEFAEPGFDWMGLFGRVALTGESARVERHSAAFDRWYSTAVYSPRKGFFTLILDDITDRKRVEEALRQGQRRLRAILDNIPDIAWLKDSESRFIAVNEPFAKACGVLSDKIPGRTDFDLWPRELAEHYREDDAEVMRSGMRKVVEEPLVDAAGVRTWIETIKTPTLDYEGRVIGTTGIARDITDRRRAEARMEHLSRVLRALRGVDQLITRERDRGKLIRGACESLVRNRGYENAWITILGEHGEVADAAESGLGEAFAALISGMRRNGLSGCARRALEGPGVSVIREPASSCGDCALARSFHGRGSMAIRLEHGGTVYGILSVAVPSDLIVDEEECALFSELARDIAFALCGIEVDEARRSAEVSLQMTARELQRSNQDLEQFAYVASHDLQEPLRMVAGYLQLLERRYREGLDTEAREFIRFAVEGAGRMRSLIADLLEYSRAGTGGGSDEPTDSSRALDAALLNLKAAIEESGAQVTREMLPVIFADGKQFVQLFQNLVGNAIRFRSGAAPCIHVGAAEVAGEWVFSVRDNGIGIDPRFAERVFVIFQRLHGRDEYPGTGIGLSVCRKIVERHGGRIWVESSPGKGATFRFTIPRKPR